MSAVTSHPHPRRSRVATADLAAAVLLVLAGPALLAASVSLLSTAPGTAEDTVLRTLGLAAGIAGLVLLAWWAVGLLGLVLQAAGRRTGRVGWVRIGLRLTPGVLQRVAAAVLGAQLIAAPAALADAGPGGPAAVDASWTAATATADPAPADRLPSAAWTPRSPQTPPPGAAPGGRPTADRPTVTVRAGDCLWDIAARELGPDATPREVDRRWRDWYRENEDVIGEDPHTLLPGTVLVTPVFSPHAAPPAGPLSP